MRKVTSLGARAGLALILLALTAPVFGGRQRANLDPQKAVLTETDGTTQITFHLMKPSEHLEPDGSLLVSVEVDKLEAGSPVGVTAKRAGLGRQAKLREPATVHALEPLPSPVETLNRNFPPGPNLATLWKAFVLSPIGDPDLFDGPIELTIDLELEETIRFTRVLVGAPSTHRALMIGAFADGTPVDGTTTVIYSGVDYLGTHWAYQRLQIPEGTLGPGTHAFDDMVYFQEVLLNPGVNNVDTVMLRTEDVPVGGTTPVVLLDFANETVAPIVVGSDFGDQEYHITARLSPTVTSGGFVTINADGTYESSTSLSPELTLQRIEDGAPVGSPIVIDTGVTPLPGYPVYLTSVGGEWTETPPPGRYTDSETSNFFYNNGDSNIFQHSNGPGPGILAKCDKASASAAVSF